MSVFRPFDRGDILFTAVDAKPAVSIAYGRVSSSLDASGSVVNPVNGWRGGSGAGSGSVSLYGGIRGRRGLERTNYATSGLSIYPLDQLDTHSIDKVIFVSGSYPATGSARFIRCLDIPNQGINETSWYEEHFRPIELLYDWYSQRDECFFTGSYDMYCLFVPANRTGSLQEGPYISGTPSITNFAQSSNGWSAEIWYKPTTNCGFNRTLLAQSGGWRLLVGSDNTVYLENMVSGTFHTGSAAGAVRDGRWNHVAVSVSSRQTASFYLNGVPTVQAAVKSFGTSAAVSVGTYQVSPSDLHESGSGGGGPGVTIQAADGFIFDSMIWGRPLSATEIATHASGTLVNSGSDPSLLLYYRFNDGPLKVVGASVAGSGTQDYSPYGPASGNKGTILDTNHPLQAAWMPNDHPTFLHKRALAAPGVTLGDFRVFHLPSMFYGREIEPGSVVLTDGQYNRRGIVRVLNDDGRGCLYLSGSMTKPISGEDYTGNTRHKVGNVFYSEGLIVITDPAFWDTFNVNGWAWSPENAVQSSSSPDLLALDFRGHNRFYTKTFNCRLPSAQGNVTANPTFSQQQVEGSETNGGTRAMVKGLADGVYITAVGLYNEERKLVAVAKLAQPLRKREKDKLDIRLRMDF